LPAYLYAVFLCAGVGHLYGHQARRTAGSAAAKAVCAPGRHFARVLPAQLRCAAGAGLCLLVRAAALAVGENQLQTCAKPSETFDLIESLVSFVAGGKGSGLSENQMLSHRKRLSLYFLR